MKTDNNGTVLYNRSELQAVFSQLQPREEYSLLHFNVKKFRYFLGRYDHETGEELLQQILKTFTKGLKKGQYLISYSSFMSGEKRRLLMSLFKETTRAMS